jgi:hypothetical protein
MLLGLVPSRCLAFAGVADGRAFSLAPCRTVSPIPHTSLDVFARLLVSLEVAKQVWSTQHAGPSFLSVFTTIWDGMRSRYVENCGSMRLIVSSTSWL